MQDSVQASIPKVGDDCQRKREIENPETAQGKQRHHFWKDSRVGADVADLCGQSIQAEEADEKHKGDCGQALNFCDGGTAQFVGWAKAKIIKYANEGRQRIDDECDEIQPCNGMFEFLFITEEEQHDQFTDAKQP